MRTTINIPTDLMERLKQFDLNNPARPLNRSAVCRVALEKALKSEEKALKMKR